MNANRPWLGFYGDVPSSLSYPQVSLYEAVLATCRRIPDAPALEFLGTSTTYRELGDAIDRCADAFASLGMRAGERLAIAMPTCPQGVIAFYAAIKLGVVPAMLHPLSTPTELALYLHISRSRFALTLDAFYDRFAEARGRTPLELLLLTRISDVLGPLKRLGFWLTRGRKIPRVPEDDSVRWWSELMATPHPRAAATPSGTNELAAILFSGGTTGQPKGIMLSHQNFIAEGLQAAAWSRLREGDRVLAILPIFHGFGLGVCINAVLMGGGQPILVPTFTPKTVAELIRTRHPHFMVGVPTLYDALSKDASLKGADLSSLRAAFCGADTLPRPVKERFERLVAEGGGHVRVLEGYGLTETVTAIMAMPVGEYREGSMGIPFPDMEVSIRHPDTGEPLPPGEEGELCIAGPAVMLGYLDEPGETARVLRVHGDGRTWLHTGDLGRMDADGFFYFTCRLKRMIKSSGFNVYPNQVEAVLYTHPAVEQACVVGVPDLAQVERVKAFVVLKEPAREGAAMAEELIAHCRSQLLKWSCPRVVEFRRELPKTRLGKIDYKTLEREERERAMAASGAEHPRPVS